MKLNHTFILYILVIHAGLLLLSLLLIRDHPLYFICVELFILLSIILAGRFHVGFFRPFNLIETGIAILQEKDFSSKIRHVGQYDMDRLIDVYNEMIDQLRKERILQQEQHYFLGKLIEASPSAIIIFDYDEKISQLNPAAIRILGITGDCIKGKSLRDIPSELARILASVSGNEARIVTINGLQSFLCHKATFQDQGFSRAFLLFDELTTEFYQKEKKSYETVIKMMAHEVNNSIGAINSILDSLLRLNEDLPDTRKEEYLDALTVAMDRNIRLNRFMSNFAQVVHLARPQREKHDLHRLLRNVQILLSAKARERSITWEWHLAEGPLNLTIDVNQVEQVLVNIFQNAFEAVENGGTIAITTRRFPAPELSIANDGKRIPENVERHLFSPFFSTKTNGQGIGLTLIREILHNHQATFSLKTEDNGWTVFRIAFPEKGVIA